MATRHRIAVPEQQWGGGEMGKGPKASDGNNRRALGDIGNLVNANGRPAPEGNRKPPQAQISRPVTRSFGAQLLRNAQEAAEAPVAAAKPVKPEADGGTAAAGKKGGVVLVVVPPKPKPRAAAAKKPPPEKTIEVHRADDDTGASSGRKRGTPREKKVHTFSSVLTARSKVACGLSGKHAEEAIPDIDAPDTGDQLAVVDYVEDIYKFYKMSETCFRPREDYMRNQTEINAKMRAILTDWLIEVHHKFELMQETLYLTVYIIDRYLSLETVPRRELQLVGMSAMLIACKYEEIWSPEVNDFICISDMAYSREQILAKEKGILDVLEWNLTVPTAYVFLVRFLKAALPLPNEEMMMMKHAVFFFAELGLVHYSVTPYRPSMLAAASVYAARSTLVDKEAAAAPVWNETLKRHTGFSESELRECAKILVELHSTAAESKQRAVYKKYCSPQRGAVALLPPATKIFEGSSSSA